ncbi:hypothetical protein AVEN_27695-1 [Araneus ventricosus]|uniref:Uncharacterized protein n=1 Tax=Araneus ventricosus TaxID=182803 RepID=A0A4Y2MIF6_ARAVE|nr:hypothetical protein AVEN_27695-1 [Araneus ventricosus]
MPSIPGMQRGRLALQNSQKSLQSFSKEVAELKIRTWSGMQYHRHNPKSSFVRVLQLQPKLPGLEWEIALGHLRGILHTIFQRRHEVDPNKIALVFCLKFMTPNALHLRRHESLAELPEFYLWELVAIEIDLPSSLSHLRYRTTVLKDVRSPKGPSSIVLLQDSPSDFLPRWSIRRHCFF